MDWSVPCKIVQARRARVTPVKAGISFSRLSLDNVFSAATLYLWDLDVQLCKAEKAKVGSASDNRDLLWGREENYWRVISVSPKDGAACLGIGNTACLFTIARCAYFPRLLLSPVSGCLDILAIFFTFSKTTFTV